MVKAVIFDCFGVLTTDHWKEFVATLGEEQVEPARALLYNYDSGRMKLADFLKEVKNLTGRLPGGIEGLLGDRMMKNTELLKYIKRLKPAYKIGLLSNIGSDWIRQDFLEKDEQALFDAMVFSFEVGMAKPDPGMFELAAGRLGVTPADCVLVDDSEGHCGAAGKLGMRTIIYKDFRQMKRQLEPLL